MSYITPKDTKEIQDKFVEWLESNLTDPYEQASGKTRSSFVYGTDFKLVAIFPKIHIDCGDFIPNKVTFRKTTYLEEEEHHFMIYYYNQKGHKFVFSGTLSDEANSLTFESNQSYIDGAGFKITPTKNCSLKTVTKHALSTCTRARLYKGTNLLGNATFSGNVATFSRPHPMESGEDYYIICDNSGISYTMYYTTSPSFSISGTNLSWGSGVTYDGTTMTEVSGEGYNLLSLTLGNQALSDENQCRKYLQYIRETIKNNVTEFDDYCHRITFGTTPKAVFNQPSSGYMSVLPMVVYTYRR